MKKAIRLFGLMALILVFFDSAISAQEVRVMTHRFYFDSDISSHLKDELAYNFTDADDGWLNGRIKRIKIIGYADCNGSTVHNLKLSEDRARTIAKAIKTFGVVGDDFLIECIGAGEQPCAGDSGDAENRRVDLIMTYEVEPTPLPEESFVEMGEQIEASGRIELLGVNFQPGRHVLLPESMAPLNQLLNALIVNPHLKIELQGHICCQSYPGDGHDNDTGLNNLSEARAKAVYDFLVKGGIGPNRLRYKGMGNYFPKVNPEITEADRIANRRVEAVVWE